MCNIPTHVYKYHKLLREREDALSDLVQAVREDNSAWAMMSLARAMITNSFIESTYSLAMARKDLLARKYAKPTEEAAYPAYREKEVLA